MLVNLSFMANKRLHTTATALASFGIRARRTCLGGYVGCVLPVRARLRLVKRSVSVPSEAWCVLQGASPCRERASHPPVASVAPVAEAEHSGEQSR